MKIPRLLHEDEAQSYILLLSIIYIGSLMKKFYTIMHLKFLFYSYIWHCSQFYPHMFEYMSVRLIPYVLRILNNMRKTQLAERM